MSKCGISGDFYGHENLCLDSQNVYFFGGTKHFFGDKTTNDMKVAKAICIEKYATVNSRPREL